MVVKAKSAYARAARRRPSFRHGLRRPHCSRVIRIVLIALNDRSAQIILNTDIEGLFDELQLLSHLSATRGNGLRAMTHASGRLPKRSLKACPGTQTGVDNASNPRAVHVPNFSTSDHLQARDPARKSVCA